MKEPPKGYDVPCPVCGQMSPLTQELSELTKREFEILELIIDGYSNKEIARLLDIREGTVKSHIISLYNHFGVSNRIQAVARGVIMLKEMHDKQKAVGDK